MRKPEMTTDALPRRGTAALASGAIGLAAAVSVGVMLWGAGPHGLLFANEFGGGNSMPLESRVAVLTAELAQVKAEAAKLRENQSDTSAELSHIRASVANAEIGLSALRTATDDNEARRLDAAAQIASSLAQLKDETFQLRLAQSDTATEFSSLRAGVANAAIGVDSLRSTTREIRQQIGRIEAARDVTGSIAHRHRHRIHKTWLAQR